MTLSEHLTVWLKHSLTGAVFSRNSVLFVSQALGVVRQLNAAVLKDKWGSSLQRKNRKDWNNFTADTRKMLRIIFPEVCGYLCLINM